MIAVIYTQLLSAYIAYNYGTNIFAVTFVVGMIQGLMIKYFPWEK